MARLVHILHRDSIGGGENILVQQLDHFGKRWDTWVLHGGRGLVSQACERLGIKHVQVPIETKTKCLLGFFLTLWWIYKIKPDIIIAHGQWGGPLGVIIGRLLGVRKIIYYVQWPCFYTDWDLFRVNRNFVAEWVPVKLCHRIFMVSEANLYQYMIRFSGVEKKTVMLSNMVDFRRIPSVETAQALRQRYGWSDDVVNVLSISRMSTQKRIDWLLRSWKYVEKTGVKAHLWLVGGGELLEEMKVLAQDLGLQSSCTFLGAQSEGIHFIKAADLVAMTTMYEGSSLVPMEVMACGKAIVANSADGVRDTFTDTEEGFLVAPGNIDLFAERLLTLIQNPSLRETMGKKGLERSKIYAADVVLDQYVKQIELELNEPVVVS